MKLPDVRQLDQCSSNQLSTLLRLAALPHRSRSGMVELLREPALLEAALEEPGPDGAHFGREDVARLTAEEPELASLIEVKEHAKRSLVRPASARQRDALTLVYHAAVAAAYGVHAASISSRPIAARAANYSDMAMLLPPGPLRDIFVKALDRLEASEAG